MTRQQINQCKTLGLLTDSDIPNTFDEWTPEKLAKNAKALEALAALKSQEALAGRFETEWLRRLANKFGVRKLEFHGINVESELPDETEDEKNKELFSIGTIVRWPRSEKNRSDFVAVEVEVRK